ncbi:ammonia-forming cytochrome c nitrite reductase subunit c552 [Pelagicoccus sp. SDUM812002]|uniref:ammonia-forming cytochrome c nitrite reductase subunit c552 n=1 Tax=Pelagicoccus sp. SDUM812002 TaxID=3041266 RepID=UPI00280E6917|nr:ammonia-forming cytochrome c nitrite reductase subunit c552 [Pelagicoccus sp. SDUM812002]MDQ8187100.1 ammonia-forming cytochrome c nitrite reductase subunit c552 [Pelagicoccus sp. SDUM812002]
MSQTETPSPKKSARLLAAIIAFAMVIAFGATALLVTIFEHKQEAQRPFVRLVEVDESTSDPVPWGTNWPYQFDTYKRSVDSTETTHGGSSALSASKLDQYPWLRRLYAGYAFSIDYRELRGHAYMLYDQEVTKRVTNRSQGGACLHCHASVIPTYRRLGLEAQGQPAGPQEIAASFNWPAVLEGFKHVSSLSYAEAHEELLQTTDGTPGVDNPLFPGGALEQSANKQVASDPHSIGNAHPVSCVDCHDPQSMALRVTRPGFILGIAALAESDDPVPHLPSVERWREGPRRTAYDPNVEASRQEMRSFSCAQCHVEYYCASKETLFFPWENGLKVEDIETTYENHTFPDGSRFGDYKHAETGATIYKAQHPEFELWSQGIHARSGVSCVDCHMPYERQGATKVSNHWVRSPLLNVNNACQTCHNVPEEELVDKVKTIQNRTRSLMGKAAVAMTDMLDSIREAQSVGAAEADLAPVLELQRKAMWRLDYISSENSLGFHADQEAARILGESIDFSRQAQAAALRLRAPAAPELPEPENAVEGITVDPPLSDKN